MKFSHHGPTKIYFGPGAFQTAADKLVSLGKRVLLVTGRRAMRDLGYTDRLLFDLKAAGAETALFDEISSSPLTREVNECADRFKEWKPEVIAALGGGSVIDAAKGIALTLTCSQRVEPYLLGDEPITRVNIPLVAIPTTAGTGSEVNQISLLTDEKKEIKKSMRHEGFFPLLAIIDPVLTLSLSREITLDTGFDVFTHAVETYISRAVTSPLVELYTREAIGIVRDHLPRVLEDGGDLEARSRMLYASMLMGLNLANSSTCMPHRLQYSVGIKTKTSHGAGLRALFRSWLDNTYEYSPAKINQIGTLLSGRPLDNKSEFLAVYDSFVQKTGINLTLADLGIYNHDLPLLSGKVIGSLNNDPAGEMPGIVDKIYRDSL